METSEITKIIEVFVDKHYPKGDKNRGFALTILAVFLLSLNEEDSKYKLIENNG